MVVTVRIAVLQCQPSARPFIVTSDNMRRPISIRNQYQFQFRHLSVDGLFQYSPLATPFTQAHMYRYQLK